MQEAQGSPTKTLGSVLQEAQGGPTKTLGMGCRRHKEARPKPLTGVAGGTKRLDQNP